MNGTPAITGSKPQRRRFSCTPAGVIAASRRRFSGFLLTLVVIMTVATAAMLVAGRWIPALLAAGVGLVVAMAWRMSLELSPQWMEIFQGQLIVKTAGVQFAVPLEGAIARELQREEKDHLRRLASTAGLVAGVGGFDSHVIGEFDLYATDLEKAVLVHSVEDRFIVSPDNPTEFLAAIAEAGAMT